MKIAGNIAKYQQMFKDLIEWNKKFNRQRKPLKQNFPPIKNLNEECYLSNYWLTKLLLVKKEQEVK